MHAKALPRSHPPHAPRTLPTSCCGPELRCGCGSLLAKLVAGAVELKCRRCKETWRIPLEAE